MALTCRNVNSSKYVSLNVVYAHALTKLNCASNFGLSRSEIMPMTFTAFIIRRLGSLVHGGSVYCLVVECEVQSL